MHLPNIALPIVTDRLEIRQELRSDADSRFALHSDPKYIEFVGCPISREKCDAQLERELNGEADLFVAAVSLRGHEEMIGECVLVPSTVGEVELIIALLPPCRGCRFSYEIAHAIIEATFRDEHITTIIACVEDGNKASLHMVKQLGMRREGIMPRVDKLPHRFVINKFDRVPNTR